MFGSPMTLKPSVAALVVLGCASSSPRPPPPESATPEKPAAVAPPAPVYGTFGFDTSGMDARVAPGDNFYQYANGKWQERTQIPPDRINYTMFAVLAEEAQKRSRGILEEAAHQDAPADSDARKLGDYFATFMDEAAIEAKGLSPLKPELERIASLKSVRDLSAALG